MRGRALQLLAATALVVALAGCGHRAAAPVAPPPPPPAPQPPAPPPPPTLTSAADLAACNELETNIRIVSQLISNSVETMTQSLHPKELAKRTGETQRNLLYAASVLSQIDPPKSLRRAQRQLVAGLHEFAADFGRAQKSVARNDMRIASRQLVDRQALANVTASTGAIDRACDA
jgi:hypothetical protein